MNGFGIVASRGPPKKVDDLEYKGIKYSAPLEKMGHIEARNIKTGKIIWDLKVYDVEYQPNLETDIQEVYIISLKIKGDDLEVVNEINEKYLVDLKNRRVRKGDQAA